MPNTGSHRRQGDGTTGWIVGGVVLALGMGMIFLAEMATMIRLGGGAGPGPLMIVTMLGAGMFGAVALGPIGRAIGKRIFEGGSSTEADALSDDVHDLRVQADELRQALMETQERLDFTERMLAGGRERTPEELH